MFCVGLSDCQLPHSLSLLLGPLPRNKLVTLDILFTGNCFMFRNNDTRAILKHLDRQFTCICVGLFDVNSITVYQ